MILTLSIATVMASLIYGARAWYALKDLVTSRGNRK